MKSMLVLAALLVTVMVVTLPSGTQASFYVGQCKGACDTLDNTKGDACCKRYRFESGSCDPNTIGVDGIPPGPAALCDGGYAMEAVMTCDRSDARLSAALDKEFRDHKCP